MDRGYRSRTAPYPYPEEDPVKRVFALLVGIAFVAGLAGAAAAQTPATQTPVEKKADDKKMDKKPSTKTAVGTVKSAGADGLVVAGKAKGKDTEWTFAVDPNTKIKKGGKDVTVKDVAAGDKVTVRYMDHDGKMTAASVAVSAAASAKAAKSEMKSETKEMKKEEKK
jgi:hypothetical protein